MTKNEIRGLLNELFPRYRQYLGNLTPEDRSVITDAWAEAFRNTGEQELREAIKAYQREKRYFPDVSELIPLLPKTEGAEGAAPYTQGEVERAYYQALWAQAGHTGIAPEGWTGEEEMSA